MKAFQRPKQDAFFFIPHLVNEERVIHPAKRLFLGGEQQLAAIESVGLIIKSVQTAVSEAGKPHIQRTLHTLLTLALDVDFIFQCNKGLDVVRLRQGLGFHVIVYQKQFVFQVCTSKAVGFYLLQTACVHTASEQFSQDQPNSGFSLTALADHRQHFLCFGDGQQAVTDVLLQGGNIFFVQQFVQELQPARWCWCIRHISDGQTVHAVFFFRGKVTVCKICTVSDMDAVCLNLRWFGCTGQLNRLHNMFNPPCYAGGSVIADLLIDFLFQWGFILDYAIHREQPALKAAHGVQAQKVICE